jgi:hypothetical protein
MVEHSRSHHGGQKAKGESVSTSWLSPLSPFIPSRPSDPHTFLAGLSHFVNPHWKHRHRHTHPEVCFINLLASFQPH